MAAALESGLTAEAAVDAGVEAHRASWAERKARNQIGQWTRSAYNDHRTGPGHSLDSRIRSWAVENDAHYFSEYLDKQIYAELAGYEQLYTPREVMLEEVNASAGDSRRAGKQVESVLLGAGTHTRMIAMNSRNRLRVFGDAVSHAAAGIEYQQVMEILDKKTCAVCWERNGTIVPTQEVIAWIGRVVEAGPGKLDETAPWIGTGAVAEHRQFSSKELCQQGKALPLYHSRCRGMVNAFQGDPGTPGTGLRGGEGTLRRAEVDKLLPAELQAKVEATRNNAQAWPDKSRRGLEWHYNRHLNQMTDLTGSSWTVEQYEQEAYRVIREAEQVFTSHKQNTTDVVRWGFYEEQSGLFAVVDGQIGRVVTMYPPDLFDPSDFVEVTR